MLSSCRIHVVYKDHRLHRYPKQDVYLFFIRFLLVLMGLLNFIGFQQVLLGFNGFYWVLLGFIGKYRDLLSFTGFCWMFICFSLGFIGFQQVLLGFTEFNRVFSGSCWVLLDFLGFQQVLLGFTGFYRVNRQKSQLAVVPRGSRSPPDLRFRFRGAGVGERCGHPIGFSLVFFFLLLGFAFLLSRTAVRRFTEFLQGKPGTTRSESGFIRSELVSIHLDNRNDEIGSFFLKKKKKIEKMFFF